MNKYVNQLVNPIYYHFYHLNLYLNTQANIFFHNSSQISINNESGSNIMTLLQTCLHSLAVMLEIKLPAEISDSIKLIEEVLSYLSALINFAPKQCVVCVKQMLKFMFRMNYTCRIEQYQQFYDLPNTMTELDIAAVFEMARNFSYESFAMLLPTASTNNIGVHIKVFQPIVLRCLKVSGTYSFFFVFRSFVRNKYILRRVKGTFLEVARFIVL